MPMTAGVFSLITATIEFLWGTLILLLYVLFEYGIHSDVGLSNEVVWYITIPSFFTGMLGIIGSLFTLYRKKWKIALSFLIISAIVYIVGSFGFAGNIWAGSRFWPIIQIVILITGIAPPVLVILSKKQFDKSN